MLGRRLAFATLVSVAVVAGGAASARAAPTVHLTFERLAGAERCPAPETVAAAVKARVGFDPFAADADRQIRCTVGGDGDRLLARIEISADAMHAAGSRSFSSPHLDCGELTDAIVLALSIAIQPRLALASPSPPTEPAPAPPPAPPPAASPPAPPSAPAAASVAAAPPPRPAAGRELAVGAGAVAAAGVAPGLAFGGGVTVGLRGARFALELDGRLFAPVSLDAPSGRAVVWAGALSLAPCARLGAWSACAVATAGAVRGRGEEVVLSQTTTVPMLAVGARLVWEHPLGSFWAVRASADASVVVARAHLLLDRTEVWVSPRVNVVAALGLGAHFP